jgi:transcription elongation factor SPT5
MHKDLGVWATRSSNVEILSAKGARPTDGGVDISRMNPDLMRHNPNGSMAPPPRNAGRDRLEGRIVMITRGDYKGMVGRVKTTNSNTVSVELEARSTKFPTAFSRDILKLQDPVTKQFHAIGAQRSSRVPTGMQGSSSLTSSVFGNLPSRVPSGSRTPMAAADMGGGRTPAWGLGDGGRTPTWKREGGGSAFDGGRTPAWAGSGGKTPAWGGGGDYGGRTVLHQSDGNRTAYGGVSV